MKKTLFDEVDLANLHLRNRLVRSATWMALADEGGAPTPELVDAYAKLAEGGIGMVIAGFTSVSGDDPSIGGMARLSDDALVPAWRELADAVHGYGAAFVVQLALGHYLRDGLACEPNAVTEADIQHVVGLFADAARRAAEAGADGVQIHLAHGFWLSRFISPLHNRRKDGYGGDQERRTRIAVEILRAIRDAAPDLHVTAKVNCSDFSHGGLTPADALVTCSMLADVGIDSIEVSGNGTSVSGIRPGADEGYFASFGKMLKAAVDVPVIVVGGWRSIERMQQALDAGSADLLSLSRPLIREPDLPMQWKNGRSKSAACVSCNACYSTPGHACIYNLGR